MLGENVHFNVDAGARAAGMQVGVRESMRDDGEARDVLFETRHGETDAVYREGTFFNYVVDQFARKTKAKPPITIAEIIERNHERGSIHMAEHEVTVQAGIRTQRALEINGRSWFEVA